MFTPSVVTTQPQLTITSFLEYSHSLPYLLGSILNTAAMCFKTCFMALDIRTMSCVQNLPGAPHSTKTKLKPLSWPARPSSLWPLQPQLLYSSPRSWSPVTLNSMLFLKHILHPLGPLLWSPLTRTFFPSMSACLPPSPSFKSLLSLPREGPPDQPI